MVLSDYVVIRAYNFFFFSNLTHMLQTAYDNKQSLSHEKCLQDFIAGSVTHALHLLDTTRTV